MALRKIVIEGDEILRKKSKEVTNYNARLHELLDDMWETMAEADGVGLAAPQVGILRRVVVIDATPREIEDENSLSTNGTFAAEEQTKVELINPVIFYTEGEIDDKEGCLSVPGVIGIVKRPEVVKVRANDRYGEEFEITGRGLLAKALCHEIDHLEGTLFTDIAESFEEQE